jgi:hypothetical protein
LDGPEKVAELTGRKQMVIIEGGKKALKSRAQYLGCSSDEVNLHKRDLFHKGRKLICIISDAASSGISLQVRNVTRGNCNTPAPVGDQS